MNEIDDIFESSGHYAQQSDNEPNTQADAATKLQAPLEEIDKKGNKLAITCAHTLFPDPVARQATILLQVRPPTT